MLARKADMSTCTVVFCASVAAGAKRHRVRVREVLLEMLHSWQSEPVDGRKFTGGVKQLQLNER